MFSSNIVSALAAHQRIQRLIPIVGVLACLGLPGCGLPRSGPWMEEMSTANGVSGIELVEVTAEVAAATRVDPTASFPETLLRKPVIDLALLVAGDGIDITIWENDGLGMFPAGPSGAAPLGEVVIDEAGNISLPYMGQIPAAGLTLVALRSAILQRLRGLIISSDVVLRLSDRKGKFVVVQGDFAKPGTYPIEQTTRKLSGLLGMAAPNQQQPEQLNVTHIRAGQAHSVRLADIYRDPTQDIALYADDRIIATAVLEYVVVLGAAGVQGRIALSNRNFSVIDALGEARGMNDATAHPKGVYVLRKPATDAHATLKMLYHFDLTRPDQISSAATFRVADGDLLYISDAPFTKVQKVMSVFGGLITGAGSSAAR